MPKNALLFPDKFILDGAISDSGIGALEVAVNSLSIASKSGAMRQASAIRVGGLGSIKNQNRGMPTLNSLLPTRSVGKFTILAEEPTGTLGYFLGGVRDTGTPVLRVDRFTFATNTTVNIASVWVNWYAFCTGNSSRGYTVLNAVFWRLVFASELMGQIGSTTFPERGLGSSLKSQSKGYMCAGAGGGLALQNVDRFAFVGEVCVSIAALVQAKTWGVGFGNRFNGYLAGGDSSSNGSLNIERFSYASETKADIAAAISRPKYISCTWMPGNRSNAYLAGGLAYERFPDSVNSAYVVHPSNSIDKFVFTGETCSLIGSTIQFGTYAFATAGNSTRVVMAGGVTHSDTYPSQSASIQNSTRVWAFTFATETNEILGTVLSTGRYALNGLDNSSL